ncbi:MAG: insulinase family protein [Candidatus Eisenbacteria bacterium]|uniref:Insulinase family protein n=1 Tax=Eiseniibacteriota bacterium TaxID=2212470 RepID=A0A538SI10_UNCEI|nr:MAG: insulinase family protein [Candidatus Eisenbacteria bacterium]
MPSQNRGFHSISGLWPLSAVAAFFLLIPTLALGQEERPAPRAVPRVPIYDPGTPVQKKVLKNGVTILVQEQRTSERVAGAVAARMGTVYESDDDAGRGQVLIKAMIAGTQKLKPVELALRLLAADAKLEAGVGPDLGQIAITTKREQVDQAIDLLSQVVLEPAFPDTAVDASRQRALTLAADENENPLKAAYSMYLASMFRGSPLARPVSGTVSGIADCRKKDLVALHQKYFAGGNMVVAFVGNFDGKRVMDQLEKAFAAAPAGRALDPVAGNPVPLAADTTVTTERDMPSSVLAFGYPAPGYTDPDYAAFKIIEFYLASPDRSPVSYWLKQRGQSSIVGVIYPPYPKRSSMAVYLGAPPRSLPAARDTVAAVMGRLRTQALDDGEWAEQLKRVQNSTFANQNDPLVRARAMSQFEAAGVGYEFQRHFEEALLKLNPESLRETAARWFTHSSEAAITPVRNESKL